MSLNIVHLIGRLGKDPVKRESKNGKAVCTFGLATSEKYKTADDELKENTVWHNIVAFGRTAEVMAEHLKKGQEVYIQGKVNNRSYEVDGETKYISEVVVSMFQFVGSKAATDAKASPSSSDSDDDDDDLPF